MFFPIRDNRAGILKPDPARYSDSKFWQLLLRRSVYVRSLPDTYSFTAGMRGSPEQRDEGIYFARVSFVIVPEMVNHHRLFIVNAPYVCNELENQGQCRSNPRM